MIYIIRLTVQLSQYMQTFKIIKKPITLKPSPPAATLQLSYNQFQGQRMRQQLEMAKHETLLKKIEDLHHDLYEKDQIMKQSKDTHLKQLMLVSIQLQHQREVTARYDAEFRKCESSRNELQAYYQMKLELLKKEMAQAFQIEISNEKQRAAEDLRLIKENYCTKIALIGQGHKQKQFEFAESSQKTTNYELRINLLQSKLTEKEKTLEIQTQRLLLLEQKYKDYQQAIIELRKKIADNQEQYQKKSEGLRQKAAEEEKLKQELYERFKAMKTEIENSEARKQELEKINLNLKSELELALRKYNYIQKELDELNRKTYKNKQEYDKNAGQGRILESGRETERDRQRQKSKDRERQAIAKYVEEIEKMSKMNEALSQQIEDKDRLIASAQRTHAEKMESVEQSYQTQIKELSRLEGETKQRYLQLEQQTRRLKEQLERKQWHLQQAKNQLHKQSEQFAKSLQFYSRKEKEIQEDWKTEGKDIQALYEKIDSHYLKELQAQRKKIDELELTLNQTHELMANQAKEKKLITAQLQQLKKSKKK